MLVCHESKLVPSKSKEGFPRREPRRNRTNMPKLEEQKLGSNIYKMVAYTLTGAPEDQLFGVNVAKVREIIGSNV